MKVLRFGAGVLFLPVCWVLIRVVWDLLQILQPGDGSILPASGWALAGGFLCWVFLYLTLPRPMRTYVLGHELTHALWGWLMGAQVSRLNVSRERGSVTLSKTNPLIVLAPYFFPFYTFLVIVLFGVLALFYAVEKYALFWLGLVGFTWGFHFTFTLSTLCQRQTDIHIYGRLFSYTVIVMLNVLGICLWIVAVSGASLSDFAGFARTESQAVIGACRSGVSTILREWQQ